MFVQMRENKKNGHSRKRGGGLERKKGGGGYINEKEGGSKDVPAALVYNNGVNILNFYGGCDQRWATPGGKRK